MKGLSSKKRKIFIIERKRQGYGGRRRDFRKGEGVLEMKPNCKNYLTNSLIFYIKKHYFCSQK